MDKLSATEMDFWRSVKVSRKDRVRNTEVRRMVNVSRTVVDTEEKKRLLRYEHVQRMAENKIPMKVMEWELDGRR